MLKKKKGLRRCQDGAQSLAVPPRLAPHSFQLVLENPSAHLIIQVFFSTRLTHRRRGGAERGGQKVGQKDEGLFMESVTQNRKVHLLPMIQTLD